MRLLIRRSSFSKQSGRFRLSRILAAVWVAMTPAFLTAQVLITDSFDSNELGWSFESRAGNFGVPTSSVVNFGYDYSKVGIPEAPNTPAGDTQTSGVRLRTNLIGVSEDQAAIYLEDDVFTGKYSVQVDMWLNWAPDPNLIGTTLHAGPFVGNGTDDNPGDSLKPVERGAGILMSSDGDCSNCDYILLKNEAELDLYSGQYTAGGFVFSTDEDGNDIILNQPGIDDRDFTPSDFNEDGFIDSADFTVWREGLGAEYSDRDYAMWSANYGYPTINMGESFPELVLFDAVGDAQPTEFENQDGEIEQHVQRAGVVGFRWVTVNIDVDPLATGNGDNGSVGTATFSITSAETGEVIQIGTVDNSVDDDPDDGHDSFEAPVDLEGRVSLVLVDFFSGGPADLDLGFVLYDNLVVTAGGDDEFASVPEPEGLLMLLTSLATAGTQFRKRRRPKMQEKRKQLCNGGSNEAWYGNWGSQ